MTDLGRKLPDVMPTVNGNNQPEADLASNPMSD